MFESSFFGGVVVGFVVASFFAFVTRAIQKERKKMGAPGKLQTVIVKTKKTPAQVVREGQLASARLAVLIVVLFGVGWVIITTLY